MKTVNIGIIGCGKIAQLRHIPEYLQLSNVNVVAVCDNQLLRAKQVATEYDIPYIFDDYRSLIDSTQVDAISICSPNSTHAEIAVYALNRGKHVFVEKPMAITAEDCLEMVEAAERNRRILLVGHQQRFNPLHQKVKEKISSGAIGKIHQFSTNYHHGGPEYWSIDGDKSWFFDRSEAGLGVIGDLGIHKIDLIQWLLDEQITEIKSFHTALQKKTSVEDSAVLIAYLRSGIVGTVNLSWNNPLQDHRTVLYGEKGVLTFGETLNGLQIEYFSGEKVVEEVNPLLNDEGRVVSGIIKHFVSCVCNQEKPLISAREAMHSMCLLIEATRNQLGTS